MLPSRCSAAASAGSSPRLGRTKRTIAPGSRPGRVVQFDQAAVVFDDARDDGEAEAGALDARGDVGLDQAMRGPCAGKPKPLSITSNCTPYSRSRSRTMTKPSLGSPSRSAARLHAFGGVLDQIEQAPARSGARRTRARSARRRLRPRCARRRTRGAGRTRSSARLRSCRRTPCAASACARTTENSSTMRPMSATWRRIVSVHFWKVSGSEVISRRILALQPFGRELDRRQRVLDLVGDAAGDVLPGLLALGGDELGHVVEGEHQAAFGVGAHADAEIERSALAHQVDALRRGFARRRGLVQQFGELRRDIDQAGGPPARRRHGRAIARRSDWRR